jgi:hypothetical protein
MAKKKKQNLDELNQTHAKIEEKEYQTLDQILGDSGSDKYGTFSEEEYWSQLNAMTKSDLQNHALKMSLIPVDNMKMLRERLLNEFRRHNNSYLRVSGNQKAVDNSVSDVAKRILAEGR